MSNKKKKRLITYQVDTRKNWAIVYVGARTAASGPPLAIQKWAWRMATIWDGLPESSPIAIFSKTNPYVGVLNAVSAATKAREATA